MTIDRRSTLALLAGGVAAAASTGASGVSPARIAVGARFDHGVASGDPSADGAVLWTRATPLVAGYAGDIALRWHVAESPDAKPRLSGDVTAQASRDHTAKVVPTGLRAGREYWYWFEAAGGTRSPVGRFRTLPVGATADAVLAVASCQLYPGGLFNAYRAMARLDRLDAVVHLGDYIYEYGDGGYGANIGRKLGRVVEPPHEIVTLADYRMRHAQTKRDPDMQAAHARAAFICVWDDHEVTNDGWIGGAQNHQPETEGDWRTRKAAAMQAYFEWMPIRDPLPGRPADAIQRAFEFGDLASLIMVETRMLARSKQAAVEGETPTADAYRAVLSERAQPKRELLGPAQQGWVEQRLTASVKAGKPWQVLGNQVVMARVAGPDLERQMEPAAYRALLARTAQGWRTRLASAAASYRAGVPFNLDSWDGYPPARERLYAAFARAGSRPVVLSGDSHAAWANDLFDAGGRRAGVEFGTTAITSPSYGSVVPGLGQYLAQANDEVAFCDQDNKGYLLLTLTRDAATADFVTVSSLTDKAFTTGRAARYRCAAQRGAGVQRVEA